RVVPASAATHDDEPVPFDGESDDVGRRFSITSSAAPRLTPDDRGLVVPAPHLDRRGLPARGAGRPLRPVAADGPGRPHIPHASRTGLPRLPESPRSHRVQPPRRARRARAPSWPDPDPSLGLARSSTPAQGTAG